MAEQTKPDKHPGGRPRLTFDLRLVEELGRIQSTLPELAAVLGCGLSTVKDRLQKEEEFPAAYERGLEAGKSSLRRLQWKTALGGHCHHADPAGQAVPGPARHAHYRTDRG